jgi:hypothetical protein
MTPMGACDIVSVEPVLPGPVPGIHVFFSGDEEDVDGRNKSGHDA